MKLGYSPYAHPGSIYPFEGLFNEAVRLDMTDPKRCDAILLWGGTDINPAIYGEEPNPLNGYNPASDRDVDEVSWIKRAQEHNVPIIGVCRGAQLLCAVAGGKLVQHCTGHGGTHEITLYDDPESRVYQTSSSHHQMMYPFGMSEDEYKLLGWAHHHRSTRYEGAKGPMEKPELEPEVVYFPKFRGLAIQGHPEWQDFDDPFTQWCLTYVKKLVNKEL